MDIDDETKADTLEAIDWQEQFEQKAEGYAHVIKNLEADVAMYKAEEESFKAKKQAAQKKLDYVKDNSAEIGRARVGKECRSRWSPYH